MNRKEFGAETRVKFLSVPNPESRPKEMNKQY